MKHPLLEGVRHQTTVGVIFCPLLLRLTCPMQPLVSNVGALDDISRRRHDQIKKKKKKKVRKEKYDVEEKNLRLAI